MSEDDFGPEVSGLVSVGSSESGEEQNVAASGIQILAFR